MASKADIARESKKLANNENARLQVTRRTYGKANRGYNIYLTYQNEWFKDNADEETVGFIDYPMTLDQVKEWLEDQETFKRLAES